MTTLRSMTVYCASSVHLDPVFHDTAQNVGAAIAARGLSLVYGGGSVGLMGELAQAAKEAGGHVVGIITEYLMNREVGWEGCDEMIVVDTMRERKRLLAQRGDAFLVLPGGLGTYEEFFEILVGRQLREHDKPIGIVNAHGYYDPLLELIEHGIEHRFIRPALRNLIYVNADPSDVLDHLASEEAQLGFDDETVMPSGSG